MQLEEKNCDSLCTKPQPDNIKTEQKICSMIEASLNKIISKEGYEKYDTTINVINSDGGNYLGDIFEVDVKGQTKNGPNETNIFVKLMPQEQFFTRMVSLSQCYQNEIFVYEVIEKIMNELYDEACISENERFKIVKYYTESNVHALFLENLNKRGYNTLDRRQVVPLNFATSAIKELAKFHSITFILKEKRSDFFENNIKTIKSPIFFDRNNEAISDSWQDILDKSLKTTIDYINDEFENKKDEIRDLRDKMLDVMAINSVSRLSSVNCMCHGDIKAGNILWKVNDEGEAETIFVDYQLINYGTPIYDILYFIYLGTDRKFRKDHLDYLKNLYHDTMTEFLKNFDLDINSFYPRHEFEKDFKEKLDYGLLSGVLYLPFLLTEDPDILTKGLLDRVVVHSSFKERINGIFQDYIEWGIL